jgi:hypothetical protein
MILLAAVKWICRECGLVIDYWPPPSLHLKKGTPQTGEAMRDATNLCVGPDAFSQLRDEEE